MVQDNDLKATARRGYRASQDLEHFADRRDILIPQLRVICGK